jgi:hypothetical protein
MLQQKVLEGARHRAGLWQASWDTRYCTQRIPCPAWTNTWDRGSRGHCPRVEGSAGRGDFSVWPTTTATRPCVGKTTSPARSEQKRFGWGSSHPGRGPIEGLQGWSIFGSNRAYHSQPPTTPRCRDRARELQEGVQRVPGGERLPREILKWARS